MSWEMFTDQSVGYNVGDKFDKLRLHHIISIVQTEIFGFLASI